MSRRLSFSANRRRKLTVKPEVVRLETKNTITEPISVVGLASGALGGLARLGLIQVHGGQVAPAAVRPRGAEGANARPAMARTGVRPPVGDILPFAAVPPGRPAAGGGGGAPTAPIARNAIPAKAIVDGVSFASTTDDSAAHGIGAPWKPAAGAGGGAAMAPRGGSGSGALGSTAAAVQGRSPLPRTVKAPAAPPTIPGVFTGTPSAGAPSAASAPVVTRNAAAGQLNSGTGSGTATPGSGPAAGGPIAGDTGTAGSPGTPMTGSAMVPENPWSLPYASPDAPLLSFPYYPLYTLDYIQGTVLFPGGYQLATLDGNVDLRAQVKNTTGVTYSWDTTNLTHATNIATSGTGNYDLTFTWTTNNSAAAIDSVTLTATDVNNDQESQTYYFEVPAGTVYANSGSASWPTSLSPDTVGPGAPTWDSQYVSVNANSGALDATIPLPSYNPNIPGLALTYNSLTADPRPIIFVPHTLDGSQAVPSKVNATLTFNGTAGTTWYYNTSQFTPGDVEQIALQANATTLSTGRYSYSAQVVDQRSTNTTFTYSGTATVLNQSTSAFGDGWTLQGLEQVTSASGGVILSPGGGGATQWFSGSPGVGGNYTTPAGDFSTLTKTSTGYTRTLPDGTQITLNSSGYETATIDLNGLHTTYAYNGSNQLSTITDPYNDVTTFTYSGSYLSTIQDSAARLTTLTFSGSQLNAVQQADGSHITFTYDSSGRMTQYKDPNGHAVTVSYDSAERVGTITRPDSTTEKFSAYQEQGWTNSGTSGSPAAATLLAESAANDTDPNGNLTQLRPDWYGLGTTGQMTDALGDVATYDRNANGLPTITIDRLDRINQFTYDALGNMTEEIYPDGTTDQYTYNSDSDPLTYTDANGHTTTNTYDSHGNLTGIQDPLHNLTTFTYTSTGQVQTTTDADNHTTTFQYDSQDRVTTVLFPDGTTNLDAYNAQGDVSKFTDGRSNVTTYAYDALDRETGTTDALGNRTTYVYDSSGNLLQNHEPTPAGQTARTTSYAYDTMNRVVTATNPLGGHTIHGYDADGNQTSVKDPMGRITTTVYDALNRPVVTIDPMNNRTTVSYDAEGETLTVTDPMNRITTYAYSVRGWVATETDPMGFIATYIYSPTGKMTAEDQYQGGQQFQSAGYLYDADDRVVSYTDGQGDWTTYSYDGVGNLKTVTDPNGNATSYAYDARDRLTTLTDALGHTTVYGYDGSGNQQTVTDALGHMTTTLYDALNRATTIISALGGITTILYDAAGRETGLVNPMGNRTTWVYDANDRLVTMTDPLNHSATYAYDADGELTDTTDRDGRRTTYSYNGDGDQTGETWVGASPSERVTNTYDADNELTGTADAFATLTFTYDKDGRLSTDATSGPGTGQPAVTLSYSYDQPGDEAGVTDSLSSQGITTYSYDLAQRMTTIATSYGGTAGPQVVNTYDGANRLTNVVRTVGASFPGVNTNYLYDSANRAVTIVDYSHVVSTQHSGYVDTPLATYVYGYDNANRVTSEQDKEGTATFTYDNADELTAVGGSRTESYGYDLNGNRDTTGYHTTLMNEQTGSPGHAYTYDNDGNLVSDNNGSTVTTYAYDYRNRLTTVRQGGTLIATYTYNALDQRIGAKDNGTQTWTVYDGKSADADPHADFNGSGSLTDRYLSGPGVVNGAVVDELLARTSSGGTTAWYLTDKLGSVRDIVDASGNELDHLVYDSFGSIITETNASNGDRFKFAGMEYDATTGQYDDNARWYGSSTGRFDMEDPVGFGASDDNLYRYVGNAPTDATDPTGTTGNGGDPDYVAAYAHYISIHGPLDAGGFGASPWDSLTLDNLLNAMDGFSAGVADAITSGLTTRIRSTMYGDIATQNHQGMAFSAGQAVGTGINFGLGFGNPCSMGSTAAAGFRAISAAQGIGDGINAIEAYQSGDYLGAGLNGLGSLGSVANLLKSCFAAGTPLLTPDGSKPIEQFRPGDWVLAAPEDDPEAPPEPRMVEEVYENYSPLLDLLVGGRTIRTTAEHPFWVRGRGWTAAQQLAAGDHLKSHDGRWVVLEAVVADQEAAPVYNLRIAEYHTYFVGSPVWAFTIWAHNACVTRWGRPGLKTGDWVMKGGTSRQSYLFSFKWQPGLGNRFASYSSGQTFNVPSSTIHWPSGWGRDGWWKGLFGQRRYWGPTLHSANPVN